MAVKETIQIGDPRLKAKNVWIKDFNNPRVKKVIKDLRDTMIKYDLIGMAAPQIGYNYKIFITQPRKQRPEGFPKATNLGCILIPKSLNLLRNKTLSMKVVAVF